MITAVIAEKPSVARRIPANVLNVWGSTMATSQVASYLVTWAFNPSSARHAEAYGYTGFTGVRTCPFCRRVHYIPAELREGQGASPIPACSNS